MDCDIDDRLRREPWDCGAADVLDVRRPLADRRLQPRALFFELRGPRGVIVSENDGVRDWVGHGHMIPRTAASIQRSTKPKLRASTRGGSPPLPDERDHPPAYPPPVLLVPAQ